MWQAGRKLNKPMNGLVVGKMALVTSCRMDANGVEGAIWSSGANSVTASLPGLRASASVPACKMCVRIVIEADLSY